jgi:hypothetical protein
MPVKQRNSIDLSRSYFKKIRVNYLETLKNYKKNAVPPEALLLFPSFRKRFWSSKD